MNVLNHKPRRKRVMTWILMGVGALAAPVLIPFVVGVFLPREFGVDVTASFAQPPDAVWEALKDHTKHPMTGRMHRSTEELSPENGLSVWREDMGSSKVRVTTLESQEPTRLVRQFQDEVVPMSMRLEYTIHPTDAGSDLRVKANGSIDSGKWCVPYFRFMIHVFGGAKKGQQEYLKALQNSLGGSS